MSEESKTEESKHDKFVRMRDARVPKAVHATALLANLSSHHYESSSEEAAELVEALSQAVITVATAFGVECSFQIGRADEAAEPQGDDADDATLDAAVEEVPEGAMEAATAGKRKKAEDIPAHLKPWPEGLTKEEDAYTFRIAKEIDRAINAIQDRDGHAAITILTGITTA